MIKIKSLIKLIREQERKQAQRLADEEFSHKKEENERLQDELNRSSNEIRMLERKLQVLFY